MVAVKAMDTTGPTPGTVIKRPAHRVIPHDHRQLAVKDGKQFAQLPAGLEKRVDYVGEFRHAFDELAYARLELGCTDGSNLEPEVP